jgi:hypothetical protein
MFFCVVVNVSMNEVLTYSPFDLCLRAVEAVERGVPKRHVAEMPLGDGLWLPV